MRAAAALFEGTRGVKKKDNRSLLNLLDLPLVSEKGRCGLHLVSDVSSKPRFLDPAPQINRRLSYPGVLVFGLALLFPSSSRLLRIQRKDTMRPIFTRHR